MKIKYEKPMVAVERYEMSQAIAACIIKIGPAGTQYCVQNDAQTPDEMRDWALNGYFVGEAKGCSEFVTEGQIFDGICYHTQAGATFIS